MPTAPDGHELPLGPSASIDIAATLARQHVVCHLAILVVLVYASTGRPEGSPRRAFLPIPLFAFLRLAALGSLGTCRPRRLSLNGGVSRHSASTSSGLNCGRSYATVSNLSRSLTPSELTLVLIWGLVMDIAPNGLVVSVVVSFHLIYSN